MKAPRRRQTFQHIDFAPYSIFGLAVACADRIQRKIDMRGQAPLERETVEEVALLKFGIIILASPDNNDLKLEIGISPPEQS